VSASPKGNFNISESVTCATRLAAPASKTSSRPGRYKRGVPLQMARFVMRQIDTTGKCLRHFQPLAIQIFRNADETFTLFAA
jgi:hypothetical protein